jgi:hypothetical protein
MVKIPEYYKTYLKDRKSWGYLKHTEDAPTAFKFSSDKKLWVAGYYRVRADTFDGAVKISAKEFEAAFFDFRFSLNDSVGIIDTKKKKRVA